MNCPYSPDCIGFVKGHNPCINDYEKCKVYKFYQETSKIERSTKGLDSLADTIEREGVEL